MDWVTARLDWTPEKAFEALAARLLEDVATWKTAVGDQRGRMANADLEDGVFFAARQSNYPSQRRHVRLELQPSVSPGQPRSIRLDRLATQEGDTLLAMLNRDGQPRFRFSDPAKHQELFPSTPAQDPDMELWQLSRVILEPLLFA